MTKRVEELICYASRTGTKRNLKALKAASWRLLISRNGVWRTEGFPYMLDPGTWTDFQVGRAWDDEVAGEFERLLDRLGAGADCIVLPDIVAGGLRSLELSLRYMNRCRSLCDLVLIAVQDGMTEADLAELVGPSVGIFLGGSTEWKLSTMIAWGEFCAAREIEYHVARVNTAQRFHLAHDAGATRVDGSSGTRYAKTMPLLVRSQLQPSLLSPRRHAA